MTKKHHDQFVFPDDVRWNDARQAWNLTADLRPAVVVLPSSVTDVVDAVEYAAERGLRIVVQGTGHGAPVHGSLDGTLLLNRREMRGVEIDAENRRARVEAGVSGKKSSVPPVSTASRRCTARRPTSASSATPSAAASAGWRECTALGRERARRRDRDGGRCGRAGRPDAEHRPVLGAARWRRRTRRRGRDGEALYPGRRARRRHDDLALGALGRGADAVRRGAENAPKSVSASGRIIQVPPLPEIPEGIRGRQIVVIDAAVLGTEAGGERDPRPLRELGPEIDTFATVPAASLRPAAHGSRTADARPR